MTGDIVLSVNNGQEYADPINFFSAGRHLLDLLDSLSDRADVTWAISGLRMGSAVAELSAIGNHRAEGLAAAEVATQGMASIRAGKGIPQDWSPDAAKYARQLTKEAGDAATVEYGGTVVYLDFALQQQLGESPLWTREFYGSVRGELTAISSTTTRRASVKPIGGGKVVHVTFPEPLKDAIKEGLFRFVEIQGKIMQNSDGWNYKIKAEGIRILPEPTLTWPELFGYLPEITEGLSLDEYMERLRAEWT